MSRIVFYPAIIFFCFVLQGVFWHLPLVALRIDLIWLLVLFLGFNVSTLSGSLIVLFLGLAQESLGAPFHGPLVLSYLIIYFLIRLFWNHLLFERGFQQVLWVVFLSLLQRLVEQGLLVWGDERVFMDGANLLLSSALQGLVSFLYFPFLENGLKEEGEIVRPRKLEL